MPECGHPFDPADPRSFTTLTQSQYRVRLVKRTVGVCVLLAMSVAVAVPSWNAFRYHRRVGIEEGIRSLIAAMHGTDRSGITAL